MSVKIDKKDLKSNQFKKEWSTIKLKDICEKGKEKNKNTTIDIVFSNSALNGIVEQSSFFYKDIANRENLSTYFIVNKDDFVYNPRISSLAPCGPINRNKSGKKGVVSPLYTVFNLKNNKCELDYLEHYFKSSCWYKYMYSIANYGARSDRMNVTDSDFFNMELSLPPIEEQQKIASILSTWDKAIELKEKLIEKKKEQKKGLMQKLLTGEVRLPGYEGEWQEVKLGRIGKTYNGLTGKTAKDFGEGKPYIPYKTIFDHSKIDLQKIDYVMINKDEKQNCARNGDIFFTTSSETPNEVGMSSVLLDDVDEIYLNSFSFGYRLNDFSVLLPEFAQHYFRSNDFRKKMYILAQGSTRFNISKNEVMKIIIKIPGLREQESISKVLSESDKELRLLINEVSSLKQQKQGLMQLLLTGKVRVKV